MEELCGRRRVYELMIVLLPIFFLFHNLIFLSCALNQEGEALLRFKERVKKDPFGALCSWEESSLEAHHCSWFGVECVDGHVISLILNDMCLEGTLAPELGHLAHIKFIMLRNNSFSGAILEEIGRLKELQVLDLGFNNFSGPLPLEWGNDISILLLDNNGLLFGQVSPELEKLTAISEVQVDESHLTSVDEGSKHEMKVRASCVVAEHGKTIHNAMIRLRHGAQEQAVHHRNLREIVGISIPARKSHPETADSPAPAPTPTPTPPPPPTPTPPPPPPPSTTSTNNSSDSSPTKHKSSHITVIISASVGAFLLVSLIIGLLIWRNKKNAIVGTWRTGLSGPLQKSLVTGIPKLKRLELETACEEFSNVIGSTSTGTLYKGTLSNGAEIAVLSYPVKTSKDWSNNMDSEFRKKVSTLSKLNHKNFLNLIGFCEEERPFTRMLAFEYAPNGTLFEHLHVRESEHLDWAMRLRVTMGIAYCLDYTHNLTPQIIHQNLTSYAINLTEDYAAKASDFAIWNEVSFAGRPDPIVIDSINSPEITPEDNVYSFGLILLEIMTGKPPFSWATGLLNQWASDYLGSDGPIHHIVDPMLRRFDVEQLENIATVIRSCTCVDPNERPGMDEVASRLSEVTGVTPEGAAPRVSPMWWAELELMSSENEAAAAPST